MSIKSGISSSYWAKMWWIVVVGAVASTAVRAGGVDFGPSSNADAGPSYIGVVTDATGGPAPDVKINVGVAKLGSTVVERSDSQGHFFIQGFDKTVSPNDVEITCSKDGFDDGKGTKTIGTDPTAPVQVLCVLGKKT